jgi:two-component system, NtrC family, response regulator AtoC
MKFARRLGGNSDSITMADFESPSMRKVYEFVDRVAPTDLDVLLIGEPGVGKEVVARRIHARSRRAGRPFIKVAVERLSTASLDLEVMGFRPPGGSNGWTELDRRDGATLYFDEITELDHPAQAALLRLLLERERRTRAGAPAAAEARLLAASSADLRREAEAGRFRRDLLLFLQGVQIRIPPLRERRGDIPRLAEHLLRTLRAGQPGVERALKAEHYGHLIEYPWPGNVRELRDFLNRILASGDDPGAALKALPRRPNRNRPVFDGPPSLTEMARLAGERVERQLILKALEAAGWNRKLASKRLSISYRSLLNKMRKLGLREMG